MSASVSWGEALRVNTRSRCRIIGPRTKDWSEAECRAGSRLFGGSPDGAIAEECEPGPGSSLVGSRAHSPGGGAADFLDTSQK